MTKIAHAGETFGTGDVGQQFRKPLRRAGVELACCLPSQQIPLGGKALLDAFGAELILVGPTPCREVGLQFAGFVQSVHYRHVVSPQIEVHQSLRRSLCPQQHDLQERPQFRIIEPRPQSRRVLGQVFHGRIADPDQQRCGIVVPKIVDRYPQRVKGEVTIAGE